MTATSTKWQQVAALEKELAHLREKGVPGHAPRYIKLQRLRAKRLRELGQLDLWPRR